MGIPQGVHTGLQMQRSIVCIYFVSLFQLAKKSVLSLQSGQWNLPMTCPVRAVECGRILKMCAGQLWKGSFKRA